nr:phospholipase-like protein [Tanacetum cinerariifolium]
LYRSNHLDDRHVSYFIEDYRNTVNHYFVCLYTSDALPTAALPALMIRLFFIGKMWIIKSSCEPNRSWTKVPEIIPRVVSWTRKAEFNKWEYFSELFHKKDSKEFHPSLRGREKGREAVLIDRVRDSEGLYFSFDFSLLNGFCNLSQNGEEKGDCEHYKYTYTSKQEDHVIRKYVDAMRSPYIGLATTLNVPSMEQLANQKNVLNPLMIEKCKSVKPYFEDLKRLFNRIYRIFLSHDLEEWLSRYVVGWLLNEHIDLWVMYLWHTRQFNMDWAMVSHYFLPLLLQGSVPLFNANNDMYPVAWSNVERVFIPINEPKHHWSLAMSHICSGIVIFYHSEKTNETHDEEFRQWYLKMKECLEEKIHLVLKETGAFEKKNIDLAKLAYGVPLAVDDLVQTALAYREKMIGFYFQYKMFCP